MFAKYNCDNNVDLLPSNCLSILGGDAFINEEYLEKDIIVCENEDDLLAKEIEYLEYVLLNTDGVGEKNSFSDITGFQDELLTIYEKNHDQDIIINTTLLLIRYLEREDMMSYPFDKRQREVINLVIHEEYEMNYGKCDKNVIIEILNTLMKERMQ